MPGYMFAYNWFSTMQVNLACSSKSNEFGHLFAEELGLVLEVAPENEQQVLEAYTQAGLTAHAIGGVTADAQISVSVHGTQHISGVPLHGLAYPSSVLLMLSCLVLLNKPHRPAVPSSKACMLCGSFRLCTTSATALPNVTLV